MVKLKCTASIRRKRGARGAARLTEWSPGLSPASSSAAAAAEQHGQHGAGRKEVGGGVGEKPLLTLMLVGGTARPGKRRRRGIGRGGVRPELEEAGSRRRCDAFEPDSAREEGERESAEPMEGSRRLGGHRRGVAGGGLLRARVSSPGSSQRQS